MASLYITEFRPLAPGTGVPVQIAEFPALATQKIAIGAEGDSAVFNVATRIIRLHADAICSITITAVGVEATATTSMTRLAADQTEYFGVQPGAELSVIANT